MAGDLRAATGERVVGGGPVKVFCWQHDDGATPSLAIYPDHGYCYGGCGYLPAAVILAHYQRAAAELPPLAEVAAAPPPLPSPLLVDLWHQTLIDPASPLFPRLAWLRQRGLYTTTIRGARLGHDGRFFVIPVFGLGGAVLAVKRRADPLYTDPDTPKYLTQRGAGAPVYRPRPAGRVMAITEGEFDALLLAQHGVDAVTSLAGANSYAAVFAGWQTTKPTVIATDQDAAGEEAAAAVKRVWRGPLRRATWSGAKDVTDLLRDRSATEREAIIQRWFREE